MNMNPGETSPKNPEDEKYEKMFSGGDFEETDDYVDPADAGEASEMDALIDQYLDQMPADVNQGQALMAPVVAIKTDGVLVDIGDKSEGFVPLREVQNARGELIVKIGDEIEVLVKGQDNESGLIMLSHREARRRHAWEEAEKAFNDKQTVKGTVIRTVKGGLIVDIGTTAFLPASQIDLRRIENFEEWIGEEVEGVIIEFTPEKRRIILSRRQLLEQARDAKRSEVLSKIEVGSVEDVVVKRIVDFGAFVDVHGMDGLIPRSEISWQRSAKPEDYLKPNDTVQVKIIEVDPAKGKITLSRRLATTDPWESAVERYPEGTQVTGDIVSLTNYGAFVRLEEGLDGMIHISDMAWDSAGRKPQDYVKEGMTVTAVVLNIDTQNHRISMGMKQLTNDPWEEIPNKYPRNTKIKGPVTGLTKYGAFVELEPGIEGMIHVSDFSWDKRIAQPRDVVKKGDELECVVLEIDRERRRISLGVKQLTESPMESFRKNFRSGDLAEGEVTKLTPTGIYVKLSDTIEGFMHVSQMDVDRVEKPEDKFKVGEKIIAKITKIEGNGKVSLSRKAMLKEQEKKTISNYMRKNESGSLLNMGELLDQLKFEDSGSDRKAKASPESVREPEKTKPAPAPKPEAKAPAAEPVVAEAAAAEPAAVEEVEATGELTLETPATESTPDDSAEAAKAQDDSK